MNKSAWKTLESCIQVNEKNSRYRVYVPMLTKLIYCGTYSSLEGARRVREESKKLLKPAIEKLGLMKDELRITKTLLKIRAIADDLERSYRTMISQNEEEQNESQ